MAQGGWMGSPVTHAGATHATQRGSSPRSRRACACAEVGGGHDGRLGGVGRQRERQEARRLVQAWKLHLQREAQGGRRGAGSGRRSARGRHGEQGAARVCLAAAAAVAGGSADLRGGGSRKHRVACPGQAREGVGQLDRLQSWEGAAARGRGERERRSGTAGRRSGSAAASDADPSKQRQRPPPALALTSMQRYSRKDAMPSLTDTCVQSSGDTRLPTLHGRTGQAVRGGERGVSGGAAGGPARAARRRAGRRRAGQQGAAGTARPGSSRVEAHHWWATSWQSTLTAWAAPYAPSQPSLNRMRRSSNISRPQFCAEGGGGERERSVCVSARAAVWLPARCPPAPSHAAPRLPRPAPPHLHGPGHAGHGHKAPGVERLLDAGRLPQDLGDVARHERHVSWQEGGAGEEGRGGMGGEAARRVRRARGGKIAQHAA